MRVSRGKNGYKKERNGQNSRGKGQFAEFLSEKGGQNALHFRGNIVKYKVTANGVERPPRARARYARATAEKNER